MTSNIAINRVGADQILELRHRILRAGLPPETACFPADDAETTLHLAAYLADASGRAAGQPVACLSFMLNSFGAEPAWQLRGMAVAEAHQGCGLGSRLIAQAEEALAQQGGVGLLWCNARLPAMGFYKKLGWTVVSEVFEIPTAGPHVKMSKKLGQNAREAVEKSRAND